ncbi:hypothetical protein [Niveispirillum fermenti]|uniref:hypothetical protein n=1 Tax=Niveispirillum fermenti TaxID=1233113 RepID=UPI003A870915
MRVATKPFKASAVAAANAETARKYKPTPNPGDPEYGAFQQDWMDRYVAEGGGYTTPTAEARQERVRQDRAVAEQNAGTRGTMAACPVGPQLSAHPSAPPPVADDKCPCKLSSFDVRCGHGRAARDNLLMVVADSVAGDKVSVAALAAGDCGDRFRLRVDGTDIDRREPGTAEFKIRAPAAAGILPHRLHKVSPTIRMVSVQTCGGVGRTVKVAAYPSGQVKFSVDLQNLLDRLKKLSKGLPVGEAFKVRTFRGRREKNWKIREGKEISLTAQWEEDEGSHLAYCSLKMTGSLAPFLGTDASYRILAIPTPPLINKYLKAGFFLNIALGVDIEANGIRTYWPHNGRYESKSISIRVIGSGSVEPAIELLVLSKDILRASFSGISSIEVNGGVYALDGENPKIKTNFVFSPLRINVEFKMAWGLINYEREWNIFNEIKDEISEINLW